MKYKSTLWWLGQMLSAIIGIGFYIEYGNVALAIAVGYGLAVLVDIRDSVS